jgi:hypothetical protein
MAREPRHRDLEGVKLEQAKSDAGLFGDDAPPPMEVAEDWLDMPVQPDLTTYPFNGAPILVIGPGNHTAEAVYRVTRKFVPEKGKWEYTHFWAKRNHGGAPVEFQPVAYRKIAE